MISFIFLLKIDYFHLWFLLWLADCQKKKTIFKLEKNTHFNGGLREIMSAVFNS